MTEDEIVNRLCEIAESYPITPMEAKEILEKEIKMAGFIQSEIKRVDEGDVIFTKRRSHMYKEVFDKEIAWLDEEIGIIDRMLKDETAQTKEHTRLYDKRTFAINERARLYGWLSEVKTTTTYSEHTEDYLIKTLRDFLVISELYRTALNTVKQNIDRSISALKDGNNDVLSSLLNKMKESCEG